MAIQVGCNANSLPSFFYYYFKFFGNIGNNSLRHLNIHLSGKKNPVEYQFCLGLLFSYGPCSWYSKLMLEISIICLKYQLFVNVFGSPFGMHPLQ